MIISGMTCAACQCAIEGHLKSLDGVISATVSLLTHKSSIQYRPKVIGLRSIIEEIEAIGFSARYEAQTDKSDIRVIINESVQKYRRKFFISLFMFIPVLFLIWILPYSNPEEITKYN